MVHEIDHMSDLHVDSSFYKQSMKIDNYFKINEWIDHSIGQSPVIQQLNKKRPTLSNSNQTQNRRRYVNFENGSRFVCSFSLNNPESTSCLHCLQAHDGSYVAVANDNSSFIWLNYKFPSSMSDYTILNKWHVISITWSDIKDLSNCWSNGKKIMTFNTGNTKGTDHCIIGNIGTPSNNSHLIGCIGEIIGFCRSLTDKETSYIHKYLMKKWGVIDDPI